MAPPALSFHVRVTLDSGHVADIPGGPRCAKSGLMHCSKSSRYSITSSAVASSAAGIVSPKAFAAWMLITSPSALLVEPHVGQVLVNVVARADLPALYVGAKRHDAVPV